MANKTFNTRVKNKRDTAANWEAVATTFQPLDGELIIVDTAAGKTRFKVGRYDTAKGRLLYYNEIPFTDEYLYNDLNESQGKIYDTIKGIDDKSIIEMTLESVFDNTKFVNYRIGLWQFSKTGFYKLNIPKRGTTATQLFVYAQKTKEDGTTPEDPFSQDNLLRISALNGDRQVESVLAQVDYTDTDTLTVYKVQFLNAITFPGTLNVNAYNKTTQKWDFTSVTESSAKWANNATQVSNALTLTKGDTTTTFDGSSAQTVSIPTKTSELTNDSDFTTQTDLDNLTNTVVSYSAQENITDEQKAQARTNIGAISSDELVQADWNQNDETAKDYVKNRFGCYEVSEYEISRVIEKGSGTFTPSLGLVLGKTYNVGYTTSNSSEFTNIEADFICQDLHDTDSSVSAGTLYFGDTNSDGFRFYDDHIELNIGFDRVVSPQSWKVVSKATIAPLPEKYYPKETAKVYVADDNNDKVENYSLTIKTSENSSLLSNEIRIENKRLVYDLSSLPPYVGSAKENPTSGPTVDELIALEVGTATTWYHPYDGNSSTKELYDLLMSIKNSTKNFGIVNLVGEDFSINLIVKKGIKMGRYSNYGATEELTGGTFSLGTKNSSLFAVEFFYRISSIVGCSIIKIADSTLATKNYVDDAIPTIDDALSTDSTNPVQNKVITAKLNEQEPLIGTTDTLTVDQVKTAILAGRPVVVSYTDTTYGELKFTNFAYSTVQNVIVSNMIAHYVATGYILAELVGTSQWYLMTTVIAEKSDLDAKIQAINNQLGGLTGAMHFIGKATVDITDGSTTDPVISGYTTKEKGDVILGKDDHKEFVWNGSAWEELGDEGSYTLKTTTINGKALSDNITLTASDVGAASASTIETMQAAIDSKPSAADAVYTATAASTDGVAYTATVSGIDSLTVGASFIMIPNKASTSKAPTLNVNGLGAKPIRRRLSSLTTSLQQGYSANWIALNKPFTVVYDGAAWVIEGLTKTDGADIYGAVAQATADANGNNIADTYATIAMLQSLLPKVTTITLTSNWVGDASPYYQDIALSCVTETSIVDLQPTPEQLNSWQDDGLAFTTLSGNGTVRVYVAGGKPSNAISVQVRVQEVTVI